MQAGGPYYDVELGRLDGRFSSKAAVSHHLPSPDFNLDQLSSLFAKHGLSLVDLVALSGTLYSFHVWTCQILYPPTPPKIIKNLLLVSFRLTDSLHYTYYIKRFCSFIFFWDKNVHRI
jgi:hypothetical protein